MLQQVETTPERVLILNQKTLQAAGLFGRVRLLIGRGEIRIVSDTSPEPEALLDKLAGWLGQEAAENYDFGLKIGGYYEAR